MCNTTLGEVVAFNMASKMATKTQYVQWVPVNDISKMSELALNPCIHQYSSLHISYSEITTDFVKSD